MDEETEPVAIKYSLYTIYRNRSGLFWTFGGEATKKQSKTVWLHIYLLVGEGCPHRDSPFVRH